MGWWLTPLGLGALLIVVGIAEHELGWLSWLGVGIVVLGLVIAILHPGSTRTRRTGTPSALPDGGQQPYFG